MHLLPGKYNFLNMSILHAVAQIDEGTAGSTAVAVYGQRGVLKARKTLTSLLEENVRIPVEILCRAERVR